MIYIYSYQIEYFIIIFFLYFHASSYDFSLIRIHLGVTKLVNSTKLDMVFFIRHQNVLNNFKIFPKDEFREAQSVEKWLSNLWVTGSKLAGVLLFISFVKFYKCTFVANVIDFDRFISAQAHLLESINQHCYTFTWQAVKRIR